MSQTRVAKKTAKQSLKTIEQAELELLTKHLDEAQCDLAEAESDLECERALNERLQKEIASLREQLETGRQNGMVVRSLITSLQHQLAIAGRALGATLVDPSRE